jgi:hypothetical protein
MVPGEYVEELKSHETLFSGASLELGRLHWLILKADAEMDSKCEVHTEGEHGNVKINLTAFGEEVGQDEIHWWIFRKEPKIEEMRERTQNTLNSAQKLKEESARLKHDYDGKSYFDLINRIKDFTENCRNEIHDLYSYVLWLHEKDILAPRVLFTYRVWGSTRLSLRKTRIKASAIDEDDSTVRKCVELVLGLRIDGAYTLGTVYSDIYRNIADSMDDGYRGPILVPKQSVIDRTQHEVLSELATFFEFFRQSLRNVIVEIEKYNDSMNLLHRESFWRPFVTKAMGSGRIETQLWDFKRTLEMWCARSEEKEKMEVKFCEEIASFANAKGGALIIGITDDPPRKIIGVQDLENMLKFTKDVLQRYINYGVDFAHFQQVPMKDELGRDVIILVIAVAQTKGVVSVKDQQGKFSYPVRSETGIYRTDQHTTEAKKKEMRDNYSFMSDFQTFLYDR